MRFDPSCINRFSFGEVSYDPLIGEARLEYAFDDRHQFVETLCFPYRLWPQDPSRQQAFLRALDWLHLIAGVSYYKAALPGQIEYSGALVNPQLDDFLNETYTRGLAEFAYVNQLDLAQKFGGRLPFPEPNGIQAQPLDLDLPERALVAVGGGKDSIVSIEMLKQAGLECLLMAVGKSPLIADTAKAAGLPFIQIERRLAPELSALNQAGAYNGHVPVTAINSMILICAALLYGTRYIVFSNEASADAATRITDDGFEVNHQYSKSLHFELGLRKLVAGQLSPNLEYFSLLRPLTELAVVQRFAELSDYHQVFSSCNRNFHLQGSKISGRWCGNCPKCRFSYLMLGVFIGKQAATDIVGFALLDTADQEYGYRELLGLGAEKPFECVGELGECRSAAATLLQREEWRGSLVLERLEQDLAGQTIEPLEAWLQPRAKHCIPESIYQACYAG